MPFFRTLVTRTAYDELLMVGSRWTQLLARTRSVPGPAYVSANLAVPVVTVIPTLHVASINFYDEVLRYMEEAVKRHGGRVKILLEGICDAEVDETLQQQEYEAIASSPELQETLKKRADHDTLFSPDVMMDMCAEMALHYSTLQKYKKEVRLQECYLKPKMAAMFGRLLLNDADLNMTEVQGILSKELEAAVEKGDTAVPSSVSVSQIGAYPGVRAAREQKVAAAAREQCLRWIGEEAEGEVIIPWGFFHTEQIVKYICSPPPAPAPASAATKEKKDNTEVSETSSGTSSSDGTAEDKKKNLKTLADDLYFERVPEWIRCVSFGVPEGTQLGNFHKVEGEGGVGGWRGRNGSYLTTLSFSFTSPVFDYPLFHSSRFILLSIVLFLLTFLPSSTPSSSSKMIGRGAPRGLNRFVLTKRILHAHALHASANSSALFTHNQHTQKRKNNATQPAAQHRNSVQAVQVCNPLSVSHLTHEQPTTTTITNTTQFNLKDQHIAIPSEARSTFPASVQTHKMEFRRINSTLQSAAVGTPRSARAAPSPTGASTPTAKTMSKASLLPGGAHGTPPCTPPPMSGKRRKHSAVPLERSNSTAGRAFQRTNSTMGRQKGETIRQNNRVNVYVRVRAFAQKERSGEAGQLAVKMKDDTVEVTVPQKGNFMFTFDGCFWSNDRDSPHHRKPDEGLVPRVCNMIFARAANSAQKGVHYTVKASMLEVYLDDVFDLLNHRKQLTVRNDFKNHTFAVVGSKNVTVTSYKDVLELLTKAEPLRTFAETKIHDHSSRAHTLFTLEVHTEYDDTEMKARCARILMADLAGCERIRLAGTEEGVGFEEARNINLSLLALGSCIEAVASRKKRDNANIPEFRNSTLTKLLKDFLGGNSVSVMMVTIAPSAKDSNLSVQTLRFADRAKQITTHAKMNVIDDEDEEKGTEKWEDSLKDEYRRKREALLSEIQLKSSIEKLGNQMKDIDAKLLHPEDLDEDTLEYLQTQQDHISNSIRSAEQQLVAPMQILYGDYLNLEEELRDANTKLAELRTGLDEELDRQRSMYEQQQREQYMAFEDEFSALRLNSSDEIERLKRIIKELEEENDRLRHNLDVSHKNEQDLADQLIDLQRLHNEATMTKQELQEHLNETVAYMQRLQESLGMSEAEMKENLARFNLLRSVLCKIDQEVKVATDGVQNPSSMGLRNCAPNVERTALKE
eukprot:gene7574-5341_t